MPKTDPRVDDYIAQAADFAQPILQHLRQLVHQACPEVTETIKWSFPVFEYHGMLCNMAGFKEHCAFGFWKAAIMSDPEGILTPTGESAMGHFGRIRSLDDLPADDVMIAYIMEAARLNREGVKVPPKAKPAAKKELPVPDFLQEALAHNEAARTTFEKFSYSHRKEYIEWLTEAKTEATRNKRLATALEWLAEGKGRNWKY